MILREISYQLSWLHYYIIIQNNLEGDLILTNCLGYIIITIQYSFKGDFLPIVLATSLLPLTSRAPMTFRQGDGGSVSWRDITHLMMLSDLPEHNLSIICTGIQGEKKEFGNFKIIKSKNFPKEHRDGVCYMVLSYIHISHSI